MIQDGVYKIGFDGSEVKVGAAEVGKSISDLGNKAAAAGEKAAAGIDKIADSSTKSADIIDKATQRRIKSIQLEAIAIKAGGKANSEYVEARAKLEGNEQALAPFIAQLRAAERQTKQNMEAQKALNATVNGTTKSSKELSFALRQVPAQFTDIVVSLQSGQKPMQVLLQQGGQLKDLFGGVGNAARALGGYVLGLVNPYTLAAGAVTALGAAYFYGSQESTRLNTALIASGNIAGGTAGTFSEIAKQVAATTGQYSESREAIQALAAGGVISANLIKTSLKGVVDGVTVTGKSVEELTKDFESLAKDPVEAIKKLNDTQNFLTADIYKQITALQEHGKTQEAATLAINTYANTLANRKGQIVENLGFIELAWKNIKRSADSAIDSIKSVGRVKTNTEQLDEATKKLKEYYAIRSTTQGGAFERAGTDAQIAAQIAEVKRIGALVQGENDLAKAKNETALAEKRKVENQKNYSDYIKDSSRFSKSEITAKKIADEEKAFQLAIRDLDKNSKEYTDALKRRNAAVANIKESSPESKAQAKSDSAAKRAADKLKREAAQSAERELNNFTRLDTSYKEKNAQILEQLKLDEKLTFSQKARIALNEQLASGELRLLPVHKAKLEADLEALAVSEKQLKADMLRKELSSFTAQETAALKDKQAALEIEYQLYGKTNEARDLALISIKAQRDVENQLVKLKEDGYDVSEAQIEQLKKEASARSLVEQSVLGQSQALKYAQELRDKNKELELDAIFDPNLRAAKELEAEASIWQERIRIAGEGTTAQKKLIDEYAEYSKNKLNAPLIDEWKKTVETYDKVFRDGFAGMLNNGKDSFKSFTKSLVTTFKTSVADQIYNMLAKPFVVKLVASLLGVGGTSAALAGDGSAGGLGSLLQQGQSTLNVLKNGFSGVQDSFIEGVAGLGTTLRSFGLDGLGTLIENNSTMIGNYLPYAGAALQLLSGNVKGAAFTAAGAAIGSIIPGVGTAIGGIVGNIVGGLFGNKKIPLIGSQASGTFDAGKYLGTTAKFGRKDIGAQSSLEQLNKTFAAQLSGLLKNFDLNSKVSVNSVYRSRTNARGFFGADFDGVSFYEQVYKDKAKNADFSKFVDSVLGTELVKAIQLSKLPDGIKSLFDGLTDKTAVNSMISASVALNSAQKQLADRFGLTVNAAATLSASQDDVLSMVNNLATAALATRTVGQQILDAKNAILDATELDVLPSTIDAFDKILKGIDTSTTEGLDRFAALFNQRAGLSALIGTTDQLKLNVNNSVYSASSADVQNKMAQAALDSMFKALNLAVPASLEQLLSMGKNIDYATEAGLNLASAFPSLVEAFQRVQETSESLTSSLYGSIDGFATLIDFNRYNAIKSNYGADFANQYTTLQTKVNAPNFASGNAANDANIVSAIISLNQNIALLKDAQDKIATYTKRSADVLVNVSQNGNSLMTEAYA